MNMFFNVFYQNQIHVLTVLTWIRFSNPFFLVWDQRQWDHPVSNASEASEILLQERYQYQVPGVLEASKAFFGERRW